MDYPKSTPGVGLVDGLFVDENPTTGQPGSLIPAAWANALMAEVLNVIKGAGLEPEESNVSQLLAAVLKIAASDFKRSVRVATTGAVALSGLQSIDGVMLEAGERVLVKNQADAAQNWIYVAAAGAWQRADDANDSAECSPGHLIVVQAGTAGAGTVWQLANTEQPVLGASELNFRLLFGKTGVVAGTYSAVQVDALGRVIAGSNPNSLAGHGITNAYTKEEVDLQKPGAASEALAGLIKIATQLQLTGGGDDAAAVTPKKLSQHLLSVGSLAFSRRMWVRDVKALGVNGGSLTAGGHRTRDLQTVMLNQIPGASLANNQITLPPGDYFVFGEARIGAVDDTRLRLYNITTGANAFESIGRGGVKTGSLSNGSSPINGPFTLATQGSLELQIWSSASQATYGNGYALSIGTNEVYADLHILQLKAA